VATNGGVKLQRVSLSKRGIEGKDGYVEVVVAVDDLRNNGAGLDGDSLGDIFDGDVRHGTSSYKARRVPGQAARLSRVRQSTTVRTR